MISHNSMQSVQSLESVRQLLLACEHGQQNKVEAILDQGLDVDAVDEDNTTALQVAAANGHDDLVRLLLMRGAGLDLYNFYGWTALMHASSHGHLNVVTTLLQNQADINARTRLGVSALILAAKYGHLNICKLLIEMGIDIQGLESSVGGTLCEFTPLMVAAQQGHDNLVRYFLDRGFDVNYRMPSTGINALMLAAHNGHMTTAQILIERGADANLTNVNDHTALEIAKIRENREVRGYLDRKTTNKSKIAPGDVKSDIIEAAKKGDIQRLKEILDKDIVQRDACLPQDGATPLMFAAMMGRLDMVQLLVDKGCDINKQDTVSGWTALMQATYHGKKNVAKCLINAGADVLIPAKNGCTAFDMASLIDDVDTELYRALAAKAVQVNKVERRVSKPWTKQNGGPSASETTDEVNEEQPRTGLKAWWSRMSNRFRNLKLGGTFKLQNNRLSPLPTEDTDSTLKKLKPPESQSPKQEPKKSASVNQLTDTNVSYETIMLETKKSASLYTLGLNAQAMSLQDSTLKPVIPPFLPPPTFDTHRSKMPPVSTKRSIGALGSTSILTSTQPIIQPIQFLKKYSSTTNLSTSPTSPTPRSLYNSSSPSSSGGASGLAPVERPRAYSSASSSTLTAGSDTFNKSGSSLYQKRTTPEPGQLNHTLMPNRSTLNATNSRASQHAFMEKVFVSPSSSASGSSTTTPRKQKAKSGSSRESTTNSTLTPSPSPTPKAPTGSSCSSSSPSVSSQAKNNGDEEDLAGILKNLALEKYQPIFEQEEVDMEAFLTLTDDDLKELGISHKEPRRQILRAITELQSGKGRERLQLHEILTQTMTSRSSNSPGSSTSNFSRWNIQPEDSQNTTCSSKTRSS